MSYADLFELDEGDLGRFEAGLHAYQHRRFCEAGVTRREDWTGSDMAQVMSKIAMEFEQRLEVWLWACARHRRESGDMGSRNEIARQVALEWGAKMVCALRIEMELCKCGISRYNDMYASGRLPWQCLNVRALQ